MLFPRKRQYSLRKAKFDLEHIGEHVEFRPEIAFNQAEDSLHGTDKVDPMRALFASSIATKEKILAGNQLEALAMMGDCLSEAVKRGGKILICGNGGSAADAQHLAAEFLIRLRPTNNRQSVPALALAQDPSTLTACGNDFGFDSIYERLLNGLGVRGDVLLAITTSGNSENVLRALRAARANEITSFGFLGAGGGKALDLCDHVFLVPSNETGRVQECHITAGHALLEFVEDRLLDEGFLQLGES